MTSDFIEKEYLGYDKQEKPKVIILIEGIDLCVDSKGVLVEPQFWLPSEIPSNIKFVLTSSNHNAQLTLNCGVLRHQMSTMKKERIIGGFCQKIQQLSQQNNEIPLQYLNPLNEMVKIRP